MEYMSVEERIRTRAYQLWEKAAEPKGTPEEYWEQARAEIDDEDAHADASGIPTEPPGTL
ncbi:DUF2934 domain-containing protein [Paraburkholderia sp. SIMBA_030]|uniref:DUF2934 domain-containing protein n=1 Tax=Paraburkholderia sp. SIMBA_030 TaxID=3085773 RepID=UPI00397E149F